MDRERAIVVITGVLYGTESGVGKRLREDLLHQMGLAALTEPRPELAAASAALRHLLGR